MRSTDMVRFVVAMSAVAACHSEAPRTPASPPPVDPWAVVPVAADAGVQADAAQVAEPEHDDDGKAPIVAAPMLPADEPFRGAVRAFAIAHHRTITGWGTLHLDGTDKPYRFASLSVQFDASGNMLKSSAHDGAYILEVSPVRYFLVTHWWNAAAFHGEDAPPGAEPPWVVLDDRWIKHTQMHNHGKANVSFGLRDGVLVDLDDDDYNSRADEDTVEHHYADDGVCKKPCPPLAKAPLRGLDLPVSGPANRIDLLKEPPILF